MGIRTEVIRDLDTGGANESPVPTNLLIPANDPNPASLEALLKSRDPQRAEAIRSAAALKAFLGSCFGYTLQDSLVVVQIAGKDLLAVRRTPAGLSVDLRVFGEDGKIIAQVANNEFFLNPNNSFRIGRPDSHTLVVYDNSAEKVLDIRYLNPASIRVTGVFRMGGRPPLTITEESVTFGNQLSFQNSIFGNGEPVRALIGVA
jgi:hypothetical protein